MKQDASQDLATIVANAGKGRSWRYLIIGGLLVAIGVGGWFWYRQRLEDQNAGPTYVTEPLKRGEISLEVTATGNLAPTNKVSVGSELSGTVAEVLVDRNDQVKKGQVVAKLDTTKLMQTNASTKANLASAQARVVQAEATAKESEANLGRLEELHQLSGGKTPSKAEMDTARATRDRGQADLQSAKASALASEAAVRTNETDLSKAVIKSPIDGIVLTRSVEPGQTVAASFTAPELFVIAESLERMELQVAVAEADIGRVEKNQKAVFTVDAWPDRNFSASVTMVAYGSKVTNNVVTYDTELEVPNPDLSLRPGMTATADISVASSKDVLVVPNAALRFTANKETTPQADAGQKKSFVQSLMPGPPRRGFNQGGGKRNGGKPGPRPPSAEKEKSHVWVLREGKPEEITVETGLTDGSRTEITSPELKEGDAIIIRAETATAS
ncbi:efflux RND transporter periplasmic adaptor subunit [Luteolibacter sp. LG18]|uniref:efflux RND transporter periplasmic adaptor subunit n=1 Tax=Luteolibacter sp. LG18 TaxID=2819286 RepID=UPI002B31CE24|nr:secretion protein HlyD [Luteolibacter sp. LG18]